MPHIHRSHSIYRWLTLLLLLLTAALIWSIVHRFSSEGLFFVIVSLAVTLWFARLLGSRIVLDERSITLHAPLRPARHVEFRQLVSVNESGRLLSALTLIYYPRQAEGLLDLETVESLTLPLLTAQDQLLATLTASIPR